MSIEQLETKDMKAPQRQKRHDIMFLLWSLLCLLLFISLISYNPSDASWSVINHDGADNAVGILGAYIADFLFLGIGYLAFALPSLILIKLWQLFRRRQVSSQHWTLRMLGLMVTLLALSGLAALSIWAGERLPAGAGGIVGDMLLANMLPMMGFAGTSLSLVFMFALGMVLFFEFSWLLFFETIGGLVLGVFSSKSNKTFDNSLDTEPESNLPDLIEEEQKSPVQVELVNDTSDELQKSKESKKSIWSLFKKKKTLVDESRKLNPVFSESEADMDLDETFRLNEAEGEDPFEVLFDERLEASQHLSLHPSQHPSQSAASKDLEYRATETRKTPVSVFQNDQEKGGQEQEGKKEIPIQPLEKRESKPSERAQKELQGNLFKSDQPLPSIALLDAPRQNQKPGFSPERLQDMSGLLVQKLADFGVKIEVTAVAPGPVITRFEIQPAPGVKASKISNLAKDLARSMAMKSVRVVEVIPGKTVMGIEVPNEDRAIVSLSEVLASEDYDKSKSPLTLALGHDIAGNPVITDLAKMPHLLVAGTTGSGKSVGVNAMLLSLLFKSTPEEVRLILVDPKMLELSVYEGIPHLLTPVITDMKEAASGLRWSVAEMERRYQLMAAMGVRNVAGYNKKVKEAIEAGEPIMDPLWDITQSFDTRPPTLEPLPYIVIVIDEFADMMMMVGKKVEELIARIAQKARAAGIHMILATQRPSVDVITGLIKANVPTRMAFQVSSKIDSRTILDQGGAEQLLGHGDMLFMPPGNALPERVHGAFVDDDEVHRVAAEWKQRGEPDYIEEITLVGEDGMLPGANGGDQGEQDELFDLAVAFVTESGKCSISSVQRKLKVGYNRAANLVESMEAAGVVSPPAHNGAREVLAPPPPQ